MMSLANITGRASVPSEPSGEKCFVRFVNKTVRGVDVIWVDFSGRFVKYTLLQNGEFIDVNTYKNHCWIAIDSQTHDAMLLNGVYRYEPEDTRQMSRYRDRLPMKLRIVVYITLPMYSLYYRTLMFARDLVNTEEDIDKLELTWPVKEQLKTVFRKKKECGILLPPDAGKL